MNSQDCGLPNETFCGGTPDDEPTKAERLKLLSEAARHLANDLFRGEPVCTQSVGCLEREENRPLTRAEKAKGWGCRPFGAYNADNMCSACRSYFFAELAAQTLHEMYCWQLRIDAEESRKQAK